MTSRTSYPVGEAVSTKEREREKEGRMVFFHREPALGPGWEGEREKRREEAASPHFPSESMEAEMSSCSKTKVFDIENETILEHYAIKPG